ncbi:MAG: hypothetical protein L0271_05460, partial [Gemmatimonadetes bacterium]|nr:hypothetical protein [Gemmatimonadota bacterium]
MYPQHRPALAVLVVVLCGCGADGNDHELDRTDDQSTMAVMRDRSRDSVTRADREAWRGVLDWPDECEQAFELTHDGTAGGIRFHDLGEGVTLAEVRCAAGAYQGSMVFVRLEERQASVARTLTFPIYISADRGTLERVET